MKLEHFLTPNTKINLKWIKDLNVSPETIKLLEENLGRTLSNISHGKILYYPPPRVIIYVYVYVYVNINKWTLLNLKAFAQRRKLYDAKAAFRMGENNSK